MEARSYIENIANRASVEATVEQMTWGATLALVGSGVLLIAVTGAHPAAIVIGAALIVVGLLVLRRVLALRRQLRSEPLDFTFDLASTGGVLSPGVALGIPVGVAAFFLVFGVVSAFSNPGQAVLVMGLGLAAAVAIALIGLPTLFVQSRKWKHLSGILTRRPDLVERLQDIRSRFPGDAPFPFASSTDEVRIP